MVGVVVVRGLLLFLRPLLLRWRWLCRLVVIHVNGGREGLDVIIDLYRFSLLFARRCLGLGGALLFFGAFFFLGLGLGPPLPLELALELAVADVVVA